MTIRVEPWLYLLIGGGILLAIALVSCQFVTCARGWHVLNKLSDVKLQDLLLLNDLIGVCSWVTPLRWLHVRLIVIMALFVAKSSWWPLRFLFNSHVLHETTSYAWEDTLVLFKWTLFLHDYLLLFDALFLLLCNVVVRAHEQGVNQRYLVTTRLLCLYSVFSCLECWLHVAHLPRWSNWGSICQWEVRLRAVLHRVVSVWIIPFLSLLLVWWIVWQTIQTETALLLHLDGWALLVSIVTLSWLCVLGVNLFAFLLFNGFFNLSVVIV